MELTLGDRLDEDRAHTVRPNRGRGRMKEVHNLLGRAGVRQSSLFSSDMYGLCFWTRCMLEFDERTIAGEARFKSVLNMRNLIWLLLTESPAVCMQYLKSYDVLARAVGHNKSIAKTRARFNFLWRSGFTKILQQSRLQPRDFEHCLQPIQLFGGYDCSEDLPDTPAAVGVRQKPTRRARARAAVGQVHTLPLRGTGVQLAAKGQARLDRGGNGLGRAARAEAAHEVGIASGHDEPGTVVAP
jgi:hypothetical protein